MKTKNQHFRRGNFGSKAALTLRSILFVFLLISAVLNAQPEYIVNGSATSMGDNCFTITPDAYWQSGSVWYYNYILLSSDFDMNFQVNLGSNQDNGADGIAFVLQPNSTNSGGLGGEIGYGGISPSIAVEYDTWWNYWNYGGDPVYDHIAVQRNGNVSPTGTVAGPVCASASSENIEDGQWHSTRITWKAASHTLSVYFDNILRLTYTDDMVTNTFGGNPFVYWGFTGATGSARNLQQVCITDVNFTDFGINFDKTNVSCHGANDGTATITSVNGGTPPYTFNGWYYGSGPFSDNTSISGLAPGTYTANYTDVSSTTFTRSVNIYDPSPLSFIYEVNNECNGNISISASGGTPPYAYSDDGGSNFQESYVFINEPPGDYNLIVKDANNCLSPVSTATVTIVNPLTLTAITSPASSGCNGSVELIPSGGTAPYTNAIFSYLFGGSSLNTNLFNFHNGNFSQGGGSLRASNKAGLTDWVDNSIVTIALYPRVAGDYYKASYNFDVNSNSFFGWTDGSPMIQQYNIAHGFRVDDGQFLYIVETNLDSYYVGVVANLTPGIWYDFKIELTSDGAVYYYKESSSSQFIPVFSITESYIFPNMGVGMCYTIYSNNYNGLNTKDWIIAGASNPETQGLCPGIYNYTVIDATECSSITSVIIDEGCSGDLTVNAGADATTYFGITSMQSLTRTAVASGGTKPYSYSWSLGRPLLCNQVNGSGDESFYGGTCTDNTCPSNGSPTGTATCSGSATITAVLLDTTDICLTVTDANGCTATDCFAVNASDVRCISGNGGGNKVKMCHHTNSNKNPWVELCVDTNAINSHLAHGDYLGSCGQPKADEIETAAYIGQHFNLYPNPATNRVTIEFQSETENSFIIEVSEITGRKLNSNRGNSSFGTNTRELDLEGIDPGIYLVALTLDGKTELKKLVIK